MSLEEIYLPISEEMQNMEKVLHSSIHNSDDELISSMSDFLLKSPGKRARPALLILSGKAASSSNGSKCNGDTLVNIAAAVELIHMASLIHDDVLDQAQMRHNKPSVNAKWGNSISIAFGDYIYSKAFELIAQSKSSDIYMCISNAIYVMCEGELKHVHQRNNFDLSKDSYLEIIKKKTATLFSASCEVGSIIAKHNGSVKQTLRAYGLNFGMAFQILDDCKDIISEEKTLGKCPGQDILIGDVTLPLLLLLDISDEPKRQELKDLLVSEIDEAGLKKIKELFLKSDAGELTQKSAMSYIKLAKNAVDELADSDYKQSLNDLTDYFVLNSSLNLVR